MPIVTYQVWLRDHDGDRIEVFAGLGRDAGGLTSISFELRLGLPGEYELRIDGTDERIESFDDDYQIEIRRRDPIGGIGWHEVFRGFHKELTYDFDEDGEQTFVSAGPDLNDLLVGETVDYHPGSPEACKANAAESATKEFVDENVGPSAGARHRAGLSIEPDGGAGGWWSGCRSRKNLLDVVREIAKAGPGDFRVVPTGGAAFEFQWRTPRWGEDRTPDNEEGNRPLIFSPRLGNVQSMTYHRSRRDEINVVIMIGDGAGFRQRTLTVTSGGQDDTPWSRRVVSRNSRNAESDVERYAKAFDVLEKSRPVCEFDVEVRQARNCRWERDWGLGDLVLCEYKGEEIVQKIVGIRVGVDERGEETITALMQEQRLGLILTSTTTSTTTTSSSTSTTSSSTSTTSSSLSTSTTTTV